MSAANGAAHSILDQISGCDTSVADTKARPHLVKVLDEAVEDGDEVCGGGLGAEDDGELVDRVGQGSPHLGQTVRRN